MYATFLPPIVTIVTLSFENINIFMAKRWWPILIEAWSFLLHLPELPHHSSAFLSLNIPLLSREEALSLPEYKEVCPYTAALIQFCYGNGSVKDLPHWRHWQKPKGDHIGYSVSCILGKCYGSHWIHRRLVKGRRNVE